MGPARTADSTAIESQRPADSRRLVVSRRDLRTFFNRAGLTVLFAACLYPFSIQGIGVNYVFVLFVVVVALVYGKLRNPGNLLLVAMAIYVIVFFVAALYQYEFATQSVRRFASFAIFMGMFAFAFIKVGEDSIAAFKTAIVLMSVYLSLFAAVRLASIAAGGVLGFEAKDLVGTQRYGFIYAIAIWLAYLDPLQKRLWGVARYPILVILLTGLVLTFSRSSIVAMMVSFLAFSVVKHGAWLRNFNLKSVGNAVVTIGGLLAIAALLFRLFPIVFDFFSVRLFGFFADGDDVIAALDDRNTSEGTRLYIFLRILEYVVRNPLTGSGYLGVWVLGDNAFGSAHSQYGDVLFRTGVVGFGFYVAILVAVMRHLKREHEALFWGAGAVLVYGLFHETFKESQGGFVAAFLIGMMAQAWRDRRDRRRRMQRLAASPGDVPTDRPSAANARGS
jgi:O-antigen ligase